jgi:hypothetical protein
LSSNISHSAIQKATELNFDAVKTEPSETPVDESKPAPIAEVQKPPIVIEESAIQETSSSSPSSSPSSSFSPSTTAEEQQNSSANDSEDAIEEETAAIPIRANINRAERPSSIIYPVVVKKKRPAKASIVIVKEYIREFGDSNDNDDDDDSDDEERAKSNSAEGSEDSEVMSADQILDLLCTIEEDGREQPSKAPSPVKVAYPKRPLSVQITSCVDDDDLAEAMALEMSGSAALPSSSSSSSTSTTNDFEIDPADFPPPPIDDDDEDIDGHGMDAPPPLSDDAVASPPSPSSSSGSSSTSPSASPSSSHSTSSSSSSSRPKVAPPVAPRVNRPARPQKKVEPTAQEFAIFTPGSDGGKAMPVISSSASSQNGWIRARGKQEFTSIPATTAATSPMSRLSAFGGRPTSKFVLGTKATNVSDYMAKKDSGESKTEETPQQQKQEQQEQQEQQQQEEQPAIEESLADEDFVPSRAQRDRTKTLACSFICLDQRAFMEQIKIEEARERKMSNDVNDSSSSFSSSSSSADSLPDGASGVTGGEDPDAITMKPRLPSKPRTNSALKKEVSGKDGSPGSDSGGERKLAPAVLTRTQSTIMGKIQQKRGTGLFVTQKSSAQSATVYNKNYLNTLAELLETERNYVRDLKLIVDVFLQPIRKQQLLTTFEIVSLFGNIESLVPLNEGFIEELELLVEKKESEATIGEIFSYFAPIMMKPYCNYCSNQPNVRERIKQYQQANAGFDAFVKKCFKNPLCRKQDLESFLILPLQRICKYPLFIKV